MTVDVRHGDCMSVLPTLAENSIDSCVTDPPYHLTSIVKRFGNEKPYSHMSAQTIGNSANTPHKRTARGFMGKTWDGGDIAFRVELWREVYRVLKPGAHLIAFSGTRTYHRMACAIEDAGFEIRDQIGWLYGSGFPKSHDVSKGIDRAAGAEREVVGKGVAGLANGATRDSGSHDVGYGKEYDLTAPATPAARQWEGWGTALKPAWEPIVLARKPLGEKTVAANVLRHGTGAINVDGCRVAANRDAERQYDREPQSGITGSEARNTEYGMGHAPRNDGWLETGRWPANVIHDGSEEVIAAFPESDSGGGPAVGTPRSKVNVYGEPTVSLAEPYGANGGSAARFFYTAKADADDRLGSKHPTVKPVDLMAYLCRLVTPPGGTVLDPFAGSGTTGMACMREGFDCILIEREEEYVADIHKRLAHVHGTDTPLFDDWQAKDSQANYELALQEMRNR